MVGDVVTSSCVLLLNFSGKLTLKSPKAATSYSRKTYLQGYDDSANIN